MSYDRYSNFRQYGTQMIVPTVTLPTKSSDYYELYDRDYTRLDNLSNDYYGDPNYDWLIMMANPEYGSMEYEIPNGVELRIPYPLSTTLEQYNAQINKYDLLNGLNK